MVNPDRSWSWPPVTSLPESRLARETLGDRGDRGECGLATVLAAAGLNPAAAAGQFSGELRGDGGGHAVQNDDDRRALVGDRAGDPVEQVLHEHQITGRGRGLGPGGEPTCEVCVQVGAAVPAAFPQGRVDLPESRRPGVSLPGQFRARALSAQAQERSIRVAASARVVGGVSGVASQRASRTASAAARMSASRPRFRPCLPTAASASSMGASTFPAMASGP